MINIIIIQNKYERLTIPSPMESLRHGRLVPRQAFVSVSCTHTYWESTLHIAWVVPVSVSTCSEDHRETWSRAFGGSWLAWDYSKRTGKWMLFATSDQESNHKPSQDVSPPALTLTLTLYIDRYRNLIELRSTGTPRIHLHLAVIPQTGLFPAYIRSG